jgi:hypothetical protein
MEVISNDYRYIPSDLYYIIKEIADM